MSNSETPCTVAHQTPLSMGFPRQENLRALPFPSLGDLPSPRIEPASPASAGRFFTTEPPGKTEFLLMTSKYPTSWTNNTHPSIRSTMWAHSNSRRRHWTTTQRWTFAPICWTACLFQKLIVWASRPIYIFSCSYHCLHKYHISQ